MLQANIAHRACDDGYKEGFAAPYRRRPTSRCAMRAWKTHREKVLESIWGFVSGFIIVLQYNGFMVIEVLFLVSVGGYDYKNFRAFVGNIFFAWGNVSSGRLVF